MENLRINYWLISCMLGVSGSSSLPTLAPDLARRLLLAVQLQWARGPLSATQSQMVLDRLKSPGTPTHLLDRHLALEEEIVGSPLTTGNQAVLLQGGPATYTAMFLAIAAAQGHVNMETYILEDDNIGWQFAQALYAINNAEFSVRLIRNCYQITLQAWQRRTLDMRIKEASGRVWKYWP